MDLSPIDSHDEQTFHLIRLPKEAAIQQAAAKNGPVKVGTIFVHDNNRVEFVDDKTNKVYSLMRNTPVKGEIGGSSHSHKRVNYVAPSEESDLLKLSLQKEEAIHLGKVKFSTLLAVPKDDETDVSTVSG